MTEPRGVAITRTAQRRTTGPAVLAIAVVLLGACSVSDLAFRQDRRLSFVSPQDREKVTLPVTIDWEIDDFEVLGAGEQAAADAPAGYFGVFVDRTPVPPGEPMTWIAEGDEACQQDPGCPDDEYLQMRGVHTTRDSEFTIDVLSRSGPENRRDMHEVTVVLLDEDGLRIGESAWRLEFEIDRSPDA